jgi:hypothetical protein
LLSGKTQKRAVVLTDLVTIETKVSGRGEDLLGLGDGLAVEGDTGLGVENGTLPEHDLEATHTTEEVLELDLAELGLAMLSLELLELLLLGRDDLGHGVLDGLGGGEADGTSAGSSGELAGGGSSPESKSGNGERQHRFGTGGWDDGGAERDGTGEGSEVLGRLRVTGERFKEWTTERDRHRRSHVG